MKITAIPGKVLVVFLASQPVCIGEIFFWQDDAGNAKYSDRPARNAVRKQINPGYTYRRVEYVYDGDTIRLHNGEKVRLLGVNTPEVETRRKSGEAGGEKAKQWLVDKLENEKVRVQSDVDKQDRYKRRLAHCFTESGEHINLSLVELGLASVNIHPPNLAFSDQLVAAQDRAQQAGLGIWRDSAYTPKPIEVLGKEKTRGWQRLYGAPVRVKPGRKYYRLIFTSNVDVRIPVASLVLFPDLNRYLGREIEVRGWPSRRKKHFSILVRHPSAIVD